MAIVEGPHSQVGLLLNTVGFRICMSTLSHPLEYAKFLIQIGHEPLPPVPTTTFLGKPKYMLPNVFQYVKYIKGIDGVSGCYRGFAPKLAGHVIAMFSAPLVVEKLKKQITADINFNPGEDEMSDEEKISLFKNALILDTVGRSVTVVVSHPFLVISARMMAQFVGGEETYNGIFSSIAEIYREQGLAGFFSGIIPRWAGELATLIITSLLIFGVNNYIIQDRDVRSFTTTSLQFITPTITYPFTVVTSCMEVNNCGLAAGLPPNMPIYRSWTSCFAHLSKMGKLHRGSGLLFRYCNSPPNDYKSPNVIF